MVVLTTEMLVADYLMHKEQLDFTKIEHIFVACSMALLVNNNSELPLEGYKEYIQTLASDLGVSLVKSPLARQMPFEVRQQLNNEISTIDDDYLENWVSFCVYAREYCPLLWKSIYTFTLKDIISPREFLELEKLKSETKYTFPDVTFDDSVTKLVRDEIINSGNLNKLPTHIFKYTEQRLVTLGYIIEGLRAYNSVSALDFVPVLVDRALFIPRLISEVDLL